MQRRQLVCIPPPPAWACSATHTHAHNIPVRVLHAFRTATGQLNLKHAHSAHTDAHWPLTVSSDIVKTQATVTSDIALTALTQPAVLTGRAAWTAAGIQPT